MAMPFEINIHKEDLKKINYINPFDLFSNGVFYAFKIYAVEFISSTTKKKQSIIYENFKVSLIHKMLFFNCIRPHLLYKRKQNI
jgi:hypothetical protein